MKVTNRLPRIDVRNKHRTRQPCCPFLSKQAFLFESLLHGIFLFIHFPAKPDFASLSVQTVKGLRIHFHLNLVQMPDFINILLDRTVRSELA